MSKQIQELEESQVKIDFENYRKVLKNKKVVADAERAFSRFSPATIDLSDIVKKIEQQETVAVSWFLHLTPWMDDVEVDCPMYTRSGQP